MGILSRLFPCQTCKVLERELEWARSEITAQNKRLIEIVEPRSNERIAASERARKPRLVPAPPVPTLPGFEPPPPHMFEVEED